MTATASPAPTQARLWTAPPKDPRSTRDRLKAARQVAGMIGTDSPGPRLREQAGLATLDAGAIDFDRRFLVDAEGYHLPSTTPRSDSDMARDAAIDELRRTLDAIASGRAAPGAAAMIDKLSDLLDPPPTSPANEGKLDTSKHTPKDLENTLRDLIPVIANNPGLTRANLAKAANCTTEAVKYHLRKGGVVKDAYDRALKARPLAVKFDHKGTGKRFDRTTAARAAQERQ